MLYLILTKAKMLAAVKREDSLQWLNPGGLAYSVPEGKSVLQVLESSLSHLAAAWIKETSGKSQATAALPEGSIPVALAFTAGDPRNNGVMVEEGEIRKIFRLRAAAPFDLLCAEPLPLSLLRALQAEEEFGKPAVVLDAMQPQINLCVCHVGKEQVSNKYKGSAPFFYLPFERVGLHTGMDHVLEEVAGQIAKAGLQISAEDRKVLQKQLEVGYKTGKEVSLQLMHEQEGVRIRAELSLSRRRLEELAATNLAEIGNELNKDKAERMGIGKVVLLGEYLDNSVVKGYLSRELHLGAWIDGGAISEEEAFEGVVKGLEVTASRIAEEKAEVFRRQQEEEARRKALEEVRQQSAAREKLLSEIAQICTDVALRADYEARFVAQGEKAGMPKEVVVWNIQEALRSAALRVSGEPAPLPIPATANMPVPAAPVQAAPFLSEWFRTEGVLIDPEFVTKKVSLRQGAGVKVLRLLEAAHKSDPDQRRRFHKLYEKELAYYQELSEIREVQEGLFYTRDFIPRETLKEYFKKSGLDKKNSFEKLSSKDIKFLLEVINEVRNLPVSHAHLNEYNILVLQEGRWRKNLLIRFTGFTSGDCSHAEMEERVHAMFSNLLGPETYSVFRKTVNP